MTDSPLAKRFVAAPDNWSRNGAPIQGITIHMAEGGGTVSWLTRNDGNSSHYVVEYDGEIVQMVAEARAAGSVNPRTIRLSNDPPYTFLGEQVVYGRTAVLSAIGKAAGDDPNRYVIAIEVEGFAATGPNAKQRVALHALVNDIRRRRGVQPALGHRDFQSYKACPGHKIPWVDYGHHAAKVGYSAAPPPPPPPTTGGSTTVAITGNSVPEVPTRLYLKNDPANPAKSRWLYLWSDHRSDPKNIQLDGVPAPGPQRPLLLTRFIDADTYAVAYEPSTPDANTTSLEYFVKSEDVLKTEPVPSADEAAIQARIAAAVSIANQKQEARVAAIKAKVAASTKAGDAVAADIADD